MSGVTKWKIFKIEVAMVIDIFNTNEKYDLILADPPWKQSRGGAEERERKVLGASA